MNIGLDPNEVLKGCTEQRVEVKNEGFDESPNELLKNAQRVEVEDEGFAENPAEVLNKQFEKMYDEFMGSDFVKVMDNNDLFQKCRDYYDSLTIEGKKQFIEHCLIDMMTISLNAMGQMIQIRQNLFTDTYTKNPSEQLDARWMDIFLYQIMGLAFNSPIPGPINIIKQKGKEK